MDVSKHVHGRWRMPNSAVCLGTSVTLLLQPLATTNCLFFLKPEVASTPDYVSRWKWTACHQTLAVVSHHLVSLSSLFSIGNVSSSPRFARVGHMAYLTVWQGDDRHRVKKWW